MGIRKTTKGEIDDPEDALFDLYFDQPGLQQVNYEDYNISPA
jgi:hypothetical protein